MPLHLFSAFGVELEYMIVERQRLNVLPACDTLIAAAHRLEGREEIAAGNPGDIDFGEIGWSNELCNHVIELKTNAPAPTLEGLAVSFQAHVRKINGMLRDIRPPGAPDGARLLPGAMHPWMDPACEKQLWPHEYGDVYSRFDQMFDCRGHGWANLQSVHLNLPFHGDATSDDEFGRLHAAIRLILPILPALAASSPFMDGRATGLLDSRLDVYRHNARNIPIVSGGVIPEPVFTREQYSRVIYDAIDQAIAPFNEDALLDHTWVNARGAIARFDRGAIEIRVLDVQECPAADCAMVAAIVEVLRALVSERWLTVNSQQTFDSDGLRSLLTRVIAAGDEAILDDRDYLAAFGVETSSMTAGELWRRLVEACPPSPSFSPELAVLLGEGPLARRLLRATGPSPEPRAIRGVTRRLADCLEHGTMFHA